jgi:hypothetical protein
MHPTLVTATLADDLDDQVDTADQPSPAEVLRAAALYLERHGWNQDTYYPPGTAGHCLTPPACALGALGMVVYGHPVTEPESESNPDFRQLDRARAALREHLETHGLAVTGPMWTWDDGEPDPVTIADWNDEPDRTQNEVITALNAAADAWDTTHPATTTGGAA